MFDWLKQFFSKSKSNLDKKEVPQVSKHSKKKDNWSFQEIIKSSYMELLAIELCIVHRIVELSQEIKTQADSKVENTVIFDTMQRYDYQVEELKKRLLQIEIYEKQIEQLNCWGDVQRRIPGIHDETLQNADKIVSDVKKNIGHQSPSIL